MTAESYLVSVYITYAVLAVGLTAWLARTLYRTGAVFLDDVFEDKPELATAVNRLLVTGFYMLNLGYASFLLRADPVDGATAGIETLARKLGILLVSLALVHFVNMAVFWRLRRRNEVRTLPPPVAPQQHVAPPPGPVAGAPTW
ncbi:MAG TPA: hypothetical protein VK507_13255 [Iamia sp.]|nr:hypothetical protein [Iamia sp.]